MSQKNQVDLNNKTILVTGSPGFIGAALVMRLLTDVSVMKSGTIISFDNMNDYYDVSLKEHRLSLINDASDSSIIEHKFIRGSVADKSLVNGVFDEYRPDIVVNLAAQAGVRYSIDYPDVYVESNTVGFYNILEACRHSYDNGAYGVEHLVFASSSSVYGGNTKIPFCIEDKVDDPESLYAATKMSNELFARCYSKLYGVPSTGLRFFTVYGPLGRPDMFYYSATEKLIKGDTVLLFNYGNMKRDFTYIDDIVEGLVRVMMKAPAAEKSGDGPMKPPYAVYNIGAGKPKNLLFFVQVLQEELLRAGILPKDYDFDAHRELVGMQPGDVPITYADCQELEQMFAFKPQIDIRTGIRRFCEWYKCYYNEDSNN